MIRASTVLFLCAVLQLVLSAHAHAISLWWIDGLSGPGYFVGVEDPTFFDSRCTRFLGVDYDELKKRTLEGGSDEEILDWCFERGRKPGEEEIEIWNAFLAKRGWRDEGSADLVEAKKRVGLGDRDDIQTWIDLHDAEEGRTPAQSIG